MEKLIVWKKEDWLRTLSELQEEEDWSRQVPRLSKNHGEVYPKTLSGKQQGG